ncbi:MAG: hypothetical protein AAF840_10685, partial [Bacteroidota bacterium]
KVTIASLNDDNAWDGAGQIYVPWIGQRLNCTFEGISVNTDGFLFDGEVTAVDDGLESIEGFLSPEEVSEQGDTATVTFCGAIIPMDDAAAGTATDSTDVTTDDPDPVAGDSTDVEAEPLYYNDAIAMAGGTSLPFVQGEGTERIAFYNMVFGPTGATFDAFSSARIPMGDRYVAFGAEGIGFQPGGLQGETQLALISPISFDWNGKMRFTLTEEGDNYVAFDCFGINEVGIQLNIDFCRELVVPVDLASGEAEEEGYASATFTGVAPGWGEFAGSVDVSPFELPQLPGWTFTIQEAVLDMAESITPESVVFPEDYVHPDVDPEGEADDNAAWEGFYLGLARVSIPDQFTGGATADSTATASPPADSLNQTEAPENTDFAIGAYQLIIDKTGFSGSIFGENILSLDKGRAGAWALSLDSVAITVLQNQFESTNLSGEVEVPAFDEPLAYNCHIQPGGTYAFSIALQDTVSMSAMVANFSLYENTEIGIEYDEEEEEFNAYAILYGNASFTPKLGGGSNTAGGNNNNNGGANNNSGAADGGGDRLTLASIDFEDFHLSSQAPYIVNIGSWALSANTADDQPVAAGFPLQLNEVSMLHDPDEEIVAFGLAMTLNLVGENDQGFGAYGRAFIICDVTVDEDTQKQEWSFNRVRLDKLTLDYVGAGFEFHGFIENFEEDETYGSGFNGGIQAGFTPGISVGASILFGKIDTDEESYRYFFADALVAFDPGIVLGTTGMSLYGFGGGVSYHMAREGFDGLALPASEATEAAEEEGEDAGAGGDAGDLVPAVSLDEALTSGDPAASLPSPIPIPGELGVSLSGVTYVPDEDVGIGIKAMIAFGTVKREVFNGDITFEVIFNSNGSLNYIGL